jgi:ADP-ribose pyrophosphatase YjhB (NUDIX family)
MLRIAFIVYQIYLFLVRPITLGVRVMMIRNGKVLLVRQTYMDGWFMPGGGVRKGETLEQSARREVREEVGAELGNIALMGAYSNFKQLKSDHNVLFFSEEFTLGDHHDREVAEVRLFPLAALPIGLWPGHRKRLEEYKRNPTQFKRAGSFPRFGEW